MWLSPSEQSDRGSIVGCVCIGILVCLTVVGAASHALAQCTQPVQFLIESVGGRLLIDPGNNVVGEEVELAVDAPGSYHLEFPTNPPPGDAQATVDLTIRDDGVISGTVRNRPFCGEGGCHGGRMSAFLGANVRVRVVGGSVRVAGTPVVHKTLATDGRLTVVAEPVVVEQTVVFETSLSLMVFPPPSAPGVAELTGTTEFSVTPVSGPPTTFTWIEPAGGPYDVPEHWDPNCDFPRLASHTVIFPRQFDEAANELASYAVSASGATAGRFIVDRTTLDLDGTATVSGGSTVEPSLTIIRAGTLLLDNGARLTGVHGSVGFNPRTGFSGQAALQILGAGSDCTLGGRLIVGEFAEGTLALADGATLSCDEAIVGDIAVGQATLRGTGSRWDVNSITIGAVSAAGTVDVRESARLEIVDRLTVGDLSTGTLRLVDGGRVDAAEVDIGKQDSEVSRGDGTLELSGDSGSEVSLLKVNGALRVGIGGDGAIFIREGGTVRAGSLEFPTASSGSARVTVQGTAFDGSFSEFTVFNPGRLGNGLLEVFNGARAFFSDLTLGDTGDTEVTVAGFDDPDDDETAATLNASRLRVGFDGFGTLNVETGGKVNCTELAVSSAATGGNGRIRVPGGLINASGDLKVSGDFQQEEDEDIVIEAGGGIEARGLRLGDEDTIEQAEIVVRDGEANAASFLAISNDAFTAEALIGVDGPAALRMENNALFTVFGSAKVGASPLGGRGLIEIGADSVVAITGNLDVGGVSPGTIRLLTESSELSVGGSAEINAGGRVEGIGTFDGARFVNPGGFVSPGLSPGTLTINGDYEQPEGGVLVIEVGGTEAGKFDVLHVTGNATLAGTVDLRFIDGFVPQAGDNVDFVVVDGTITGKLTGSTFIEAAGDPDSGQPAAEAEVTWEVTPEGTCRLTVTDVTPLDDSARLLPPGCGAGVCGAGVVPVMPLTFTGLAMLKVSRRRCAR
jgi:T5SS/PEP-CTERM-associated repeat protein